VRALREQLQQQLLHLHHLLRQGLLKSRPRIRERRARQCCMMQKAHCFSLMTRKPKLGESVAVASSESIKPPTVEALAVQCVCLHVWRCLPNPSLSKPTSNWVKLYRVPVFAQQLCWDVIVCMCYMPVAQGNAFRKTVATLQQILFWDRFCM